MINFNGLLSEIGSGVMTSTAYDTSWLARLGEVDSEISNHAMEWLAGNQLPDGSWGAKDIYYYHDRVICTLAAMIALTRRGKRSHDKVQVEKGLQALERITSGATGGLASDPNGATVGFEMIVPTLVSEAEKLGLIKQQGDRILGRMAKMRAIKIDKLAGRKVNKYLTPAFSAEMAGIDGQGILEIDNLQEPNGSVANSPSATAYFSIHLDPENKDARAYLRRVINEDQGAPNFAPIDVFEVAWSLWNLRLIPDFDDVDRTLVESHLKFLADNWDDTMGIGTASNGTIKDGDDSGLVYEVLSEYGISRGIEAILQYEEADHFRCFSLESNPSISTNIHILGALRQHGFQPGHAGVRKLIDFLRTVQQPRGFWFDKWHASPYYATSHAIITFAGYENSQIEKAIEWMMSTQREDGSWGHYASPTLEETSYGVQALAVWNLRTDDGKVKKNIKRAMGWLGDHIEDVTPPLWIGKALYCPNRVVRSTILGAMELAERVL